MHLNIYVVYVDEFINHDFIVNEQNNLALTNNHASMETILDYSQGHSTTHFEVFALYLS